MAALAAAEAGLRELGLQAAGLALGQVVALALHITQQTASLGALLEAAPELVERLTLSSDYVHRTSFPRSTAAPPGQRGNVASVGLRAPARGRRSGRPPACYHEAP